VETRALCFRFPVDPTNPLAYSPTVEDAGRVPELIAMRLGTRAAGDAPPFVQVIGDDYWPLPWYLRRYERTGYWASMPATGGADVVIATGSAMNTVADNLGPGWRIEHVGLRAEVVALLCTREAGARP
jgi:predicted membrane-bound mannosyltransferase